MKSVASIMGIVAGFCVLLAAEESAPRPLVGRLLSADPNAGSVVVLPTQAGGALDPNIKVTVATDLNTKVTLDHKRASLEDLAPNMQIVVKPPTGTAASIDAWVPRNLEGRIVSVDATAGRLVVQVDRGQPATVTPDANTNVLLDHKACKLDSLQAGMRVEVVPGAGVPRIVDAAPIPSPSPIASPSDSPQPSASYSPRPSVSVAPSPKPVPWFTQSPMPRPAPLPTPPRH